MTDLLAGDAVLVTLLVMGVGAGLGTVRVRGVAIGPAAALFVGLAIGAIDESLTAAAGLGQLRELGLVLFTYTIGLASGPTFFNNVRRGGAVAVAVTVGLVGILTAMCAGIAGAVDLAPAERAGLFAGAATNTPALQAAAERLDTGNPVIAYSLAYPSAVLAMLLVASLVLGRRLPVPARLAVPEPPRSERLVNWTVRVTAGDLPDLGHLRDRYPGIAFSRVEVDGRVEIATADHAVGPGATVVVVGPESTVRRFAADIGERSDRHLPLDRSQVDYRRIVVSDRKLAGGRLGDLDLPHHHGVVVSRVRRGDEDLVAHDGFELELGDRLRVVGPTERLDEVSRLFGNSERRTAEVDAMGFAVGAAAGVALGTVDVQLGGLSVELGVGGGPLVVGLVLGLLSRTGPVTWQIPYGANQVIRQLGVLMFLATAGVGSGTAFADAVVSRRGAELALSGAVVGLAFAALVPLAVTVVARRDAVEATGMLGGIETQPAALAYALDRTGGDERVSRAYALVFPVAMVAKIVLVQLLV